MDVVVEYEYTAKEEDELSLKLGDIITNVAKLDGGWWEGNLNGKRGMFPDNFVKVSSLHRAVPFMVNRPQQSWGEVGLGAFYPKVVVRVLV